MKITFWIYLFLCLSIGITAQNKKVHVIDAAVPLMNAIGVYITEIKTR